MARPRRGRFRQRTTDLGLHIDVTNVGEALDPLDGASDHPLAPEVAWGYVEDWLASELVWIPLPTSRHSEVLGHLIARYRIAGNLVPDAQLAALAVEHGVAVCSTDTDFARFTELRWINPLAR